MHSWMKGTKTKTNLLTALRGESHALAMYTYYANKAKRDGFPQIAAFFTATAEQEKEHARIWFTLLYGDVPDTLQNLGTAADGENSEGTEIYPRMAREAREEGFGYIAFLFESMAKIERTHEQRFKILLKSMELNLDQQKAFKKKPLPAKWECARCGFIHQGEPTREQRCQVCAHPMDNANACFL